MILDHVLSKLNEQQRLAVEHMQGPSLVIAGAGSGKTRVLTTRIAYLIYKGIDPFNILALTFTNKAAREMRDRIESMVGTEAKNLWMGTFHSVFARILRSEANRLGYPTNFTIYDTDDSKSLVRQIIKEEQLDKKLYKPAYVFNRISSAKNSFIKPREYLEDEEIMSEDYASGRPKLGEIYLKYVQRCFKAGAMDFDDLLLKTHDLLNKFPDVLNKYQHFFKFVLIDEFQDTNLVQYLIVKKLSASHRNLTVVGDDAQSIYSFRGANIKNILDFEKDYPEMATFKLEQNYRSTKVIVNASDNIIKRNKHQLNKNLWTQNEQGSRIKLFKADSENDEGKMVALAIEKEILELRLKYDDVVILYRTNAQSRAFEESLRRKGIPYRIVGSLSFYQRKEIKDLLAYFRFSLNPNDEESLRRIINFPARGIGEATLAKIRVWAEESNSGFWDVISNIRKFPLSTRLQNAINDFAGLIQSFMLDVKGKNAFDAAQNIAKASGIQKLLYEDKTPEGIGRYENLQTLLTAFKEFSEREDIEDKSLGTFLQEVSLLTDEDTRKDEGDDKVTMMTAHAAKGLEYPLVFVVGLEENLFPSQLSLNSREDIEEERRLFYVALTRAKQKLYLSFATSRFRWGNFIFCEPSRFLDEIDSDFIEFDQLKPKVPQQSQIKVVPKSPVKKVSKKPRVNFKPSKDFKPEVVNDLKPGMEVEHERFGLGKVLQMDGDANNRKATIFFDKLGQKQILLRFAKMRILK